MYVASGEREKTIFCSEGREHRLPTIAVENEKVNEMVNEMGKDTDLYYN